MTYSSLPGLNFSLLKHVAQSPAHFVAARQEPPEDRDTFRMGRLLHTLVMEPERFGDDYAVWPHRRGGKEWDAFAAENADVTIIKPDMLSEAQAMAYAVNNSPLVTPYLHNARHELTVQWTDERTGLACKARLDWLTSHALVDLKTTRSTDARAFGRQAAALFYPQQLAFYRRAARSIGWKGDEVAIVAVEKDRPHDVAVFRLDDEALSWGERVVDGWLDTVQRCIESGRWPGRYDKPEALMLPAWATDVDDLFLLEDETP